MHKISARFEQDLETVKTNHNLLDKIESRLTNYFDKSRKEKLDKLNQKETTETNIHQNLAQNSKSRNVDLLSKFDKNRHSRQLEQIAEVDSPKQSNPVRLEARHKFFNDKTSTKSYKTEQILIQDERGSFPKAPTPPTREVDTVTQRINDLDFKLKAYKSKNIENSEEKPKEAYQVYKFFTKGMDEPK